MTIPVRPKKSLQRVSLEMSLKPFKSMEREAIEAVCTEAIRQWLPLIGMADSCSMLLWVADGSEILVWDGDMQREIEWARYIGYANEQFFGHLKDETDPRIAQLYTSEPARITYGDLQFIIASFKKIAAERFGIHMEVGATFDAGPEFAYSDFKYKLHPEINRAEVGGQFVSLKADYTVVCGWSKLKEDNVAYAAYPGGIPEGTAFGEFLGRQCARFLPALGFDYIWFSNGFALSYFPWTYLGANYDGTQLGMVEYEELSTKMLSFWDLFKQECPNYRTEIRGTNYGTGMDLAKDCIPLLDLYERSHVEFPPPNSPWGALNYDFGLELTGYMSRIAVLPGQTFLYRFYANDPWFWQNPWWDLYDREPHDIYCPLTVARINTQGELESPGVVQILTIDSEKGELDEDIPMEVIPHIKKAFKDAPDQPGILTWLYPFRELHEAMAESNEYSSEVFFHDWFVRNAINQGLPLNTVLSTDDFYAMQDDAIQKLQDTILFTSASWIKGEKVQRIIEYIRRGGKIIFYGHVEDSALRELLNVRSEDELEGAFSLNLNLLEDTIKHEEHFSGKGTHQIQHHSHISGGGVSEVVDDLTDGYTLVHASVNQTGVERAFALTRTLPEWDGGKVGWVRGSLPFQSAGVTHLPVMQEKEFLDSSLLVRYLLQQFGYSLSQIKEEAASESALMFITRHDNAFIFTGCKQDTSVGLQLRFPDGSPLIIGQSVMIGEGTTTYALDRTYHDECRIFVNQKQTSRITCRENSPYPTSKKHISTIRNLSVYNLIEADVTIYPPLAQLFDGVVEVKNGEHFLDVSGQMAGNCIRLTNISGNIDISW
ncbi:hypothetical protein A8709_29925 [Paenibacillus pectinilyticus]|uniref:Beta-galactosidase trimerisation domain-containing protein n=1 Tax=Paenibacillus pectinilyticus TaxID=512399 RepID=A0A1C0ZVF0_9BACL|nr:hypothetical protein [Paenibacillus pectinilyticus]OCT12075.1 hypothetical protein A8709_29925 [Paenibacillus pectinilyticus]